MNKIALDTQREWKLEELQKVFAEAADTAKESIRKMVFVVGQCLKHGYDMEWITTPERRWLVRIAEEQLLLEVYERFSHTRALWYVSKLPLHEQKKLAAGSGIDVVVYRDGKTEMIVRDPLKMELFELRQVFSSDGVRDKASQVAWLDARSKEHMPGPKPKQTWLTHRDGTVTFTSPCKLTKRDILSILEEL